MTPEQEHAQASIDAIKLEQALVSRAQSILTQLAAAQAAYAQCCQVTLTLQQDMTVVDAERRQLILIRDQPKRYGVTKWKANMQYRQCGQELRRIKADLRYALLAERKAGKYMDRLEKERATIAREQKRNTRAQIELGLIPKPKRRDSLPPLIELAQYTGLLDGSW